MPRKFTQIRLPLWDQLNLMPSPGREEPTIWVRRLLLWHDISQAPVRNVELRRGLNIIWSPVGTDQRARAIGHAAGKSLFCRLLRYCLGESGFADPNDTTEIRRRFPNGAVAAEVNIRSESWAVRRCFAAHGQSIAARVGTADQLVEGSDGFGEFIATLQNASFDAERLEFLPPDAQAEPWQFLLAWLTRDQECRIDGLTHWRHSDSDSHSAVLQASAAVRLQFLRVVLGLYSAHARSLREIVAEARHAFETARDVRTRLEAQFEVLQGEVATALEIDRSLVWPPLCEDMHSDSENNNIATHRQRLLDLAAERIRTIPAIQTSPDHSRNAERLAEMRGRSARIKQRIKDLESNIARDSQRIELLDVKSVQDWTEVRFAKHPFCPLDGTPLDVEASRAKCPLVSFPDPADARRIADETQTLLREARAELTAHQEALETLREQEAALAVEVQALTDTVEAQHARVADQVAASRTAWGAQGQVQRFFAVRAELDKAQKAETAAQVELRTRQDQQTASLPEHSTGKLQLWFDFLVQRVIAREADGTVTLDGNGLHPRIQWRGRRRSLALNSLQIVLFDLAAMFCAVEGDSCAPAFLVHDSPREGDLDPWTYGCLFEATLELGRDEDSAPFQYIITTTTDPPDLVRARVRLNLGADTEEHRLFKVDL